MVTIPFRIKNRKEYICVYKKYKEYIQLYITLHYSIKENKSFVYSR